MVNKNLTIKDLFDLAVQKHDQNDFTEAKNLYEKIIQINPNLAVVHNNLGLAFIELVEIEKSKICFEKAIQIDSNYVLAHNNLGLVFNQLGETQEAIRCFKKAIQIDYNYADAHNNLGLVFYKLYDIKEAIRCFKKAIQIDPKNHKSHHKLMEIYEKIHFDKELKLAILNAKNLIKNDPGIILFEGIFFYKKEKFKEAINNLESISFPEKEKSYENFRVVTLAKCYDQIGDIDKAFDYFEKGNQLSMQSKRYMKVDKNKFLKKIITRRNYFKKSKVKKWSIINLSSIKKEPVFLFGFPRSGTTLLDTILMSHPQIEVIEEKPAIEKLVHSLNELTKNNLSDLKKIENNQIQKIRKIYFDSIESEIKNRNDSKLYIDKLPLNIIYVGEISRIFPNAKFIISLRHPCDCVLSCFMQNFFLNDAMSNFLNLDDSAYLYDAVMGLWTQYKTVLPINYKEIKYENLIQNFEITIKSVLDFLELSWHDSLFEYYKTAKQREIIATASYHQVIKPIYSHASGRWTRYKKQISNIYPILEPWIKTFNY